MTTYFGQLDATQICGCCGKPIPEFSYVTRAGLPYEATGSGIRLYRTDELACALHRMEEYILILTKGMDRYKDINIDLAAEIGTLTDRVNQLIKPKGEQR